MKKIFVITTLIIALGLAFYFLKPDRPAPEPSEEGRVLGEEYQEVNVPILVYHHIREFESADSKSMKDYIVPPADLKEQLTYLKENGFKSVSFDLLYRCLTDRCELPAKPVIISFDDGLLNQYQNAFPILKELGINATFFIYPNPIGINERFMDWEQLAELVSAGMEIGAHGWYHENLYKETEPEILEREIIKSRSVLEEKLGIKVNAFAYPFGQYNDQALELVKQNYQIARKITHGSLHTQDSLLELNAYIITSDFSYFKSLISQ